MVQVEHVNQKFIYSLQSFNKINVGFDACLLALVTSELTHVHVMTRITQLNFCQYINFIISNVTFIFKGSLKSSISSYTLAIHRYSSSIQHH